MKLKPSLLLILICALFALALMNDRSTSVSIERVTSTKAAQAATDSSLLLSVNDVKQAFEEEGLILEPWMDKSYYTLNNVKASMFLVNDGRFAIYVFKTEEDRQQARIDFNNQTAMAKVALSRIFEVKNLLVFELKKPKGSGFRVNEILAGLNGSPLLLGTNDVITALNVEGVKLQQTGITSRFFKLETGIQEGFQLNTKEQLYIYCFDSKEKVDAGLKKIEEQTALVDFIYTPIAYKVHNILIMYLKIPANQGQEVKINRAIYGDNES